MLDDYGQYVLSSAPALLKHHLISKAEMYIVADLKIAARADLDANEVIFL